MTGALWVQLTLGILTFLGLVLGFLGMLFKLNDNTRKTEGISDKTAHLGELINSRLTDFLESVRAAAFAKGVAAGEEAAAAAALQAAAEAVAAAAMKAAELLRIAETKAQVLLDTAAQVAAPLAASPEASPHVPPGNAPRPDPQGP